MYIFYTYSTSQHRQATVKYSPAKIIKCVKQENIYTAIVFKCKQIFHYAATLATFQVLSSKILIIGLLYWAA